MRGSVRRERVVGVSAARAWELVGRPELLHQWFPGIVESTVSTASAEGTAGNGGGASDTRTITTGTGLRLTETILTNDPLQRRFQYRIDGGLFREHLATIDVIGLDDGSCLVVYATDCEPAALALVLGGATQGALDELARQLEAE